MELIALLLLFALSVLLMATGLFLFALLCPAPLPGLRKCQPLQQKEKQKQAQPPTVAESVKIPPTPAEFASSMAEKGQLKMLGPMPFYEIPLEDGGQQRLSMPEIVLTTASMKIRRL